MTQQVSRLSLTAKARVQSQRNSLRICGTKKYHWNTFVFFSNPSVFLFPYHSTTTHMYVSVMNVIQRRFKRLCRINHKERGREADTQRVFQMSAQCVCSKGIGAVVGFSTPLPKVKNVYSTDIKNRNWAYTERF